MFVHEGEGSEFVSQGTEGGKAAALMVGGESYEGCHGAIL